MTYTGPYKGKLTPEDPHTFELWTNGERLLWMDEKGRMDPLSAASLLEYFTDHRLLEPQP